MTQQSEIVTNAQGRPVLYAGPDAVNLFRAKTLIASLRLYARTGMIPTRGVTATKMLDLAFAYTGKKYKRGEHLKAADDVQKWADTMQAALPITQEK